MGVASLSLIPPWRRYPPATGCLLVDYWSMAFAALASRGAASACAAAAVSLRCLPLLVLAVSGVVLIY